MRVKIKKYFDEIIRLRDESDRIRYQSLVEQIRALKELVLSDSASSTRAISTAINAADRATEKATQANEKRFDNTNEWRDAMNDLQSQFPRKAEIAPMVDGLRDRISVLERTAQATTGGKAQLTSIGAMVMGGVIITGTLVSIALSILNFIARHP